MKPVALLLAAAAAVAGLAVPTTSVAGTQVDPVELSGQGRWTLPELGSTRLSLPVGEKVGRRAIAVEFPAGARQPRRPSSSSLSYLIHMNLFFRVRRSSGSGVVVFSGITNGCASAQVNVHVHRRPGRDPIVTWNSTELINGIRGRREEDRSVRLNFSNYLPFCGVKPGRTKLQFVLQKIGAVKLDQAVVLPSSGLEVSDIYRAQLALKPEEPDQVPRVGEKFEVPFDIANIGDAPAHGVAVELLTPGDELRVAGPRLIKIGDLTGKKSAVFHVVGKRTGKFRLELQAFTSNANQPAAVMKGEIAARDAADSGLPGAWLTLLWAAAVLICGAFFLRLWRRRNVN